MGASGVGRVAKDGGRGKGGREGDLRRSAYGWPGTPEGGGGIWPGSLAIGATSVVDLCLPREEAALRML